MVARRGWDGLHFVPPTPAVGTVPIGALWKARSLTMNRRFVLVLVLVLVIDCVACLRGRARARGRVGSWSQDSISAPCDCCYGPPGCDECAVYGLVVAALAAGWSPRLRRSFSVFRASRIAAFCFSAHEGQMPWVVGVSNARLRNSSRRTHLLSKQMWWHQAQTRGKPSR